MELPANPNLEHLKNQAKALLAAFQKNDPEAQSRFKEKHPEPAKEYSLVDAQLVVAREYGFDSWPKLKNHVEGDVDRFLRAVVEGDNEAAEAMLTADPSLPSKDICAAVAVGDVEATRQILAADPSLATKKAGPYDWEPIVYLAYSRLSSLPRPTTNGNFLECARLLIENGADVNTSYVDPDWPDAMLPVLWIATCESHNIPLTELLLEKGANPDDGESVYHAAQKDHIDALELLKRFGVNLSGPFKPWNNTPLYFLMGHKPGSVGWEPAMRGVRWLLENGADPNARSYEPQETALHGAIRNGQPVAIVQAMVEHGADVTAARADGMTAYEMAAIAGLTDIADYLAEHGAPTDLSPDKALLAACSRGDLAEAKAILARDPASVERTKNDGGVLAAHLAMQGNLAGVRTLVEMGYDVSTKNDGAPALHWASWNGYAQIVSFLLGHGGDIALRDDQFSGTPLGWAIHGSQFCRNADGDYPATVSALLAAGATVDEIPEGVEEPILSLLKQKSQ